MSVTYFKRYRMQIDLREQVVPGDELPEGYRLYRWDPALIGGHAEAKYQSFRYEVDANVFPCLGDLNGCRKLMHEISCKDGFLPQTTWLMGYAAGDIRATTYCGTIQGIHDQRGVGSIQNVGIAPDHRGRGLGTHLLMHSLAGFFALGIRQVTLEVTAQNEGAIRLYQRMGFRTVRTVYKTSRVAYEYAQ